MNKFALFMCPFLLIQCLAQADTPTTLSSPITVSSIDTGILGPPAETRKITAALGNSGVLFIRSEARWNELKKLIPDLSAEHPIPELDFAKQSVVLVYSMSRRSTDSFTLSHSDLAANPPQLTFLLRWDNSFEEQLESRDSKFIYAVIPAAPTVQISLFSNPTLVDGLRLEVAEFSAIIGGKDGGDIVDGLQAKITPKTFTIKLSEDILVDFELHIAQMPHTRPEQFCLAPHTVHIWDGKYSKGYRNHAFFITSPDGKTTLLRPQEIRDRKKDVPRPIAISAKEPYHLPNGAEGDTFKSLKALGLDTSAPGTYTITGLYEEYTDTVTTPEGQNSSLWGGSIASNTITVEVKP